MPAAPPSAAPRSRKCLRRLLWLLAVCAALAAVAWVYRAPLLIGLGKAWIVDDPLTRADAIVILGGGIETRPFEAARLYRQAISIFRKALGPVHPSFRTCLTNYARLVDAMHCEREAAESE